MMGILLEFRRSVYGGDAYTLHSAVIDASSSGNTEVVAALSGKAIVVIGIVVIAAAALTVKFQSSTTDITGPLTLAANGGFSGESRHGLFGTALGEALNINLSASEIVGGFLSYCEL